MVLGRRSIFTPLSAYRDKIDKFIFLEKLAIMAVSDRVIRC